MDGKKVKGIEYINKKGERKSCFANKEVILSAGALGSPLILMRSGIGDPNDITKHGIDLVHELKGVGKNMQDHYGVTSSFYSTKPVTLHRSVSWIKTQIAGIKYLLFGTGDAAYPPCSGGGFIKSSPEKDLPDTQLHYVSIQGEDQHFRTGVTKEHGFSCIAYICRPQSRGYLTLKSADPEDEPLLYPNYLSEEEDVIDLRNALRETRRILMQPAFDEFRGDPVKPGSEINIDNDEELDNWIRENGETLYHPVSTCKMGNDEMSVVDDDLKVHGIDGLRVVDASIMPTLIAGNTNAPAIMIAEKAADLIRQAS
jgi:choline dehydrogenase